jgi:hypothetical protein
MKRWPIIRHVRALRLMLVYLWKATSIWGLRDVADLDESGMYWKDRVRAHAIWNGLELDDSELCALDAEMTEAEQRAIASLESATPEWQARLARRICLREREH